jgi:diacylglycerol kinase family enzyme
VVHNAAAGWGELSQQQLLTGLEQAGYETRLANPDSGLPKRLAKICDVVIAAGGDGTVVSVARRMVGSGVPLIILPLGTANNLARSVGMQARIESVLQALEAPHEVGLDMGVATGSWGERYFSESAGVGWFCEALEEELEDGDKKSSRALEVLTAFLERYVARRWTVTLDGADFSGEYLLAEVMNAGMLGPNVELAAAASPFDGALDVVLLTERDRPALLAYLDALRHGQAPTPPKISRRRAKHVHFTLEERRLRIDDAVRPKKGAVTSHFADVRVLPAAIRLWLPPQAAQQPRAPVEATPRTGRPAVKATSRRRAG